MANIYTGDASMNKSRAIEPVAEESAPREPLPQLARERMRAAALSILQRRYGGVWIAVDADGNVVTP
jgi:hypothetical protein